MYICEYVNMCVYITESFCCAPETQHCKLTILKGLPGRHSGKESACQYRRHGFDPWVEKIPPE